MYAVNIMLLFEHAIDICYDIVAVRYLAMNCYFESFEDHDLSNLLTRLDGCLCFKDEYIFRYDDPMDYFYIILSGYCAILAPHEKDFKGKDLRLYGKGSIINDVDIMNGYHLSNSLVCISNYCYVYRLHKQDYFQAVIDRHEVQHSIVYATYRSSYLFEGIPFNTIKKLVELSKVLNFSDNEYIIQSDQQADFVYFLSKGCVLESFFSINDARILRYLDAKKITLLSQTLEGDRYTNINYFGEQRLLGQSYISSVQALGSVQVIAVSANAMKSCIDNFLLESLLEKARGKIRSLKRLDFRLLLSPDVKLESEIHVNPDQQPHLPFSSHIKLLTSILLKDSDNCTVRFGKWSHQLHDEIWTNLFRSKICCNCESSCCELRTDWDNRDIS